MSVADASERGAGAALGALVVAAVMMAALGVALLGVAHLASRRAAQVADLAALSAVQGAPPGQPSCLVAAEIAAFHRSTLLSCTPGAGGDVTVAVAVEVPVRIPGMPRQAVRRARAAPPP